MNANQLIENLYKSVDAKDLNYLQNILAEDVRFRIGSNDAIQGIDAVDFLPASNPCNTASIRYGHNKIM